MVSFMSKEEFYKAKAEAEKKGHRWHEFIDESYGNFGFTSIPYDEETMTDEDKKRFAENQKVIDELEKEIEEYKRKEQEKK